MRPLLGLLLADKAFGVGSATLNMFSLIGFVLLVGLVTKNAILLVEFANQQTEKGADPRDAIVEAGKVRLRPILMTMGTAILAMVPISLTSTQMGGDGPAYYPMARAIAWRDHGG